MKSFIIRNLKLVCVCLAVIWILSIITARLPLILVSGMSMAPTYLDNEIVYLDYGNENIRRGDVIIFKQKVHFSFDEKLIKRVCGVPGDQVYKDKDDNYFIYDGENIYYYDKAETIADTSTLLSNSTYQYSLMNNQFFCMGDNRPESVDSRSFGAIDRNKIIARVKDGYICPKAVLNEVD